MPSSLRRRLCRNIAALMLAVTAPISGAVQSQDRAGAFDYHILAVSWMPAFCETTGEARDDPRCAAGTGHGWMLHGLWPQHADGSWPEYCETPWRNPSRRETAEQADLFGVSWAAWHQWNKHGRCSGMSADEYFALSRVAIEQVTLPDIAARGTREGALPPAALKAAFLAANPDFGEGMLTVTCRHDAVRELRLCLTRALKPRPCDAATLRRACPVEAIRIPAPR